MVVGVVEQCRRRYEGWRGRVQAGMIAQHGVFEWNLRATPADSDAIVKSQSIESPRAALANSLVNRSVVASLGTAML